MPSVEDIIKYHFEGDFFDFKQEEYKKVKKHELIRDVMALANSEYDGDRFIIIGIHKDNKNDISVFDIKDADDSAIIQQTIYTSIQPELKIEYTPYKYEGRNLMILTIKSPIDQPYATKKAINLPDNKGIFMKNDAMKIRKGSFTLDMTRSDLERIYKKKYNSKPDVEGKIKLVFSDTCDNRIKLNSNEIHELPSHQEIKKKVKEIKAINDSETTPLHQNTNYQPFNQNTRLVKLNKITELQNSIERIPEI